LYPEDGDSKLIRKFRNYVAIDRASYPRRLGCSSTLQSQKQSKAIPLQAWTDPEGSRRLRLPDLKPIGT